MHLILTRTRSDSFGTFGVLQLDGHQPFCTVEPPWIEWRDDGSEAYPYGQPYKSCVPLGRYRLQIRNSPKYGPRYHLIGHGVGLEPRGDYERFACMVHPANWARQLKGCIAVGSVHTFVAKEYGVSRSGFATQRLEKALEGADDIWLLIRRSG